LTKDAVAKPNATTNPSEPIERSLPDLIVPLLVFGVA
jgi:hypothetical protein